VTAIELLRQRGPMPALRIAQHLRLQPETVYGQLVRAFDKDQARVNVVYEGSRRTVEWEAMDEMPA
jgi:hypothetical protein